jgi:alginate O-acetyltransferase complex protein AlgI
MNFCSPIFLFLFSPAIVVVYWTVPHQLRNTVLLVGSLIFYAWGEGVFVLVMLGSIVWNWLFGLALQRRDDQRMRHAVLVAAAALNLGLLVFFKYSGFLLTNLNDILATIGVGPVEVIAPHLPLGISFFTFHSLSYVVDVYRRVATAQTNPIRFALYISFFPQLIAGPIIRYYDIYR